MDEGWVLNIKGVVAGLPVNVAGRQVRRFIHRCRFSQGAVKTQPDKKTKTESAKGQVGDRRSEDGTVFVCNFGAQRVYAFFMDGQLPCVRLYGLGRTRTGTAVTSGQILSLLRLPIPPRGQKTG